ncbi:MAG: tRNA uridine-5-carboxymethylaminomethyl(34) synthesis GTPase MnmE, partial [Firmicutes bacterium]|nr:tRNA uridine-5-carboxymethylaminomethyl(34) synthesis GTPase MnmE [Bacillota bacterium]
MKAGMDDTIAAISTPPGEGAIGIVRVSGPAALEIVGKVFRGRGLPLEKTGGFRARYGFVVDPATGERIDEVIVLVLRSPHSYTREDTVEINCHGGIVPIRQILLATLRAGARPAEPGEFTKRAFLNGRLDLAQAEAVLDVIRARTERGVQAALAQLKGRLSQRMHALGARVLGLIAQVEAGIDFPEEDVPEATSSVIAEEAQKVLAEIGELLSGSWEGKIIRDGLRTAIVGLPNVGKSSLLNALLREERAIVTAIPGTTRDLLEEGISIRGIPLVVVDTAGLRESEDVVEQIGVARAREAMSRAELVLVVLDDSEGLREEEREILREVAGKAVLVFINKTDLGRGLVTSEAVREILEQAGEGSKASLREGKDPVHMVPAQSAGGGAQLPDGAGKVRTTGDPSGKAVVRGSARLGLGLEELEAAVEGLVFEKRATSGERPCLTNVRHIRALEKAAESLEEVIAGGRA